MEEGPEHAGPCTPAMGYARHSFVIRERNGARRTRLPLDGRGV